MGLVKARNDSIEQTTIVETPPSVEDLPMLVKSLRDPDPELRRMAAKDLGLCAQAVHALAGALEIENDRSVREVLLTSLGHIGNDEAVSVLMTCLRSDSPHVRNEAIEVLKTLPQQVAPHMERLLKDIDPDVRIFAVNVLESLRHPKVVEWLREVVEEDTHVNVCATALDLLSEVGDESCIESLLIAQSRFVDEPYLQFAVRTALDRIEHGEGDE